MERLTPEQLIERREALVENNRAAMARLLNTPLSTYWKWEKGLRRIPGLLSVALDGLEFAAVNKTTRGTHGAK